eukprot:3350687-Rhodomonas_salina.1
MSCHVTRTHWHNHRNVPRSHWQTRTRSPGPGLVADLRYLKLTRYSGNLRILKARRDAVLGSQQSLIS